MQSRFSLDRLAAPARILPCLNATWFLTVMGLAVFAAGCGPSTGGRVGVAGNVVFRGAPVKVGAIEFVSQDGSAQTGAPITEGRYSVPAERGLRPGDYTVRISATEEQGAAASGPPGPPGPESMRAAPKELIPAEYNAKSKLTVTVPQGGSKDLNFELN